MSISHNELKRLLHYAPETGIWTWAAPRQNREVGALAGCKHKGTKYHVISIRFGGVRKQFRSHRLAWFYMTGHWPQHQIDHRDRDRTNDRWSNSREATRAQNNANTKLRITNKCGLKGVHWEKRKRKWLSAIKIDNKSIFLGLFDCPAAAHFAYIVAADIRHGEFACAG